MGIGQLMLVDGGGAVGQALYESRATPAHNPGTLATDGFGQYYRYVKAGASALVAGNVIQGAAVATNHHDLTPSAAAIGDTSITVTLGATLATAGQYAGGFAVISTTPGLGQSLIIEGHPAAAQSATLVLTLGQPLRVALTASSQVTLVANPHVGVIQAPVTTLTGPVVGVATYVIAASEWGWIGCGGVHGTLCSGTPIVGSAVVSPGAAAGSATTDPANAAVDMLGVLCVANEDGEVNPVKWYLR